MRSAADDRQVLFSPKGVALLEYDSGLWVDEVAADVTAEKSPGEQVFSPFGEAGTGVVLLLELPAPVRAGELSMECVLFSAFGGENIVVPLDSSSSDFRIHLNERTHAATVAGLN